MLMLLLSMKLIKNVATADVNLVCEDDKKTQLLLMLLLSMKMIKNVATADFTPVYEDDKKRSYC